ncbi:MAG: LysR family transcriptional regulator [Clostridiales Family XIII bacterium]|jgi:DNA-binding transcriptional LysR family regulator|nr:LysR family transcriptional regulator [Clostridiales Family XIII bacterium]
MEIRQIEYFLMVADSHSFSKAAKNAFISQQALSKSIKNLEGELKVPLFKRTHAGVQLTSFGSVFFERAIKIIDITDEISSTFVEMDKQGKRVVRLGTPLGILRTIDIEKLYEFQNLHPDWELSIHEGTDSAIENAIINMEFDIGFVMGNGDMQHLNYDYFNRSDTAVIMHEDNPLALRSSVSMKDLRNEGFLICTSDFNAHQRIMSACADAGFSPRIEYLTSDILLTKELLKNNKGIIIYPAKVADDLSEPNIVSRPIVDDPYIYTVYIITKKGRKLSEAQNAVRQFLLDLA